MKDMILQTLDKAGIAYRCVEHKAVFTVADVVEELEGKYPVKNLLLKEEKGDRCVLVVMKGDERLDTKALAATIGSKKLQFAKPELLLEKLNVTPGAVSLFSMLLGSAKDVELVIDERLKREPEVGFHPGVNTETVFIAGHDIEKLLESKAIAYQWLSV